MSKLLLGSIYGVAFGVCVVLMMIPMEFSDKRAALIGAFISRFGLGFVIGAAQLAIPGWASGLLFGLLLSLPDAIITKAYQDQLEPRHVSLGTGRSAIVCSTTAAVRDPCRGRCGN